MRLLRHLIVMPLARCQHPGLAARLAFVLGLCTSLSCGGGGDGGNGPSSPKVVVDSLLPDTATAGRAAFQVTVHGRNFVSGAEVLVDGATHATSFNSATRLFFTITNTDLAVAGTRAITVSGPGVTTSDAVPFQVLAPPPAPALGSLSVDTVPAGVGFTITAAGQHIRLGSRILWDGQQLTSPGFLDSTQVQGVVPGNLVTHGTHQVAIITYPPGGGTSSSLPVVGRAGLPSASLVQPDTATAGRTNVSVTVFGTGFHSASVVRFNGVDQTTTFNPNSGQLTVAVGAAALAAAGTVPVTVFTPAPGGGSSAPLPFTVKPAPPVPVLAALDIDTVLTGNSVQVVATGSGFIPGTVLRWNGVARPSLVLSDSQITAAYTGGTPGVYQVTAFTPAPGGGTSNALPFLVKALNPAPVVTSASPTVATVGPSGLVVSLHGHGFLPSTTVSWLGSPRSAALVDSTRLDVTLLPGDLAVIRQAGFQLVNPGPGGGSGGFPWFVVDPRAGDFTLVNEPVMDLAWDATRQRLYAALAGTSAVTNGRVSEVDLATGAIVRSLSTILDPVGMRLSPDGGRLYVAAVDQRNMMIIDLATLTQTGGLPLDTVVTQLGFYYDVNPAEPSTVVATTSSSINVNVLGMWVNGQRVASESSRMVGPLVFSEDGMFLYTHSGFDTTLVRIQVGGGTFGTEDPFPTLGFEALERWFDTHGGRMFSNRGRVIDLATMTRLPSLGAAARQVLSLTFDAGTQRLYTLEPDYSDLTVGERCALVKYDLVTLQYLDEVLLPIACPPPDHVANATGFVRTGAGAVAFRAAGGTLGVRLVLLRGTFVE